MANHIGPWDFRVSLPIPDPDDRGIRDPGMREKQSLQFRRGDLLAFIFDEFLFPIDDADKSVLVRADIARAVEAIQE